MEDASSSSAAEIEIPTACCSAPFFRRKQVRLAACDATKPTSIRSMDLRVTHGNSNAHLGTVIQSLSNRRRSVDCPDPLGRRTRLLILQSSCGRLRREWAAADDKNGWQSS